MSDTSADRAARRTSIDEIGAVPFASAAAAGGSPHIEVPVAYDAILLAGFGGPEGQDDVIPFLRNVTRGRGIPDERLEEVAHHYRHFGGVSPINAQNRALKAALEAELASRGIALPVYWGNRNWAPYLEDAVREAAACRRLDAACTVDERLLLVLELPAVPRGLRARAHRDRARRDRDDRQGAPVLRSPRIRAALHRWCARRGRRFLADGVGPARRACAVLDPQHPAPRMRSGPALATSTSARAARMPHSTSPSRRAS